MKLLYNTLILGPLTPEQKASLYKKSWLNLAINKFWDFTKNAKFGGLIAWANELDQKVWMNLWSFFNSVVGDEVTQKTFSKAIKTLEFKSNKMDVTSFLDLLGRTNFSMAAGFNVNGSLGYEGFKGVMAAFAIVDAQTIIQVNINF